MKYVFSLIVAPFRLSCPYRPTIAFLGVEDYLSGAADDREIALPEGFDSNMDSPAARLAHENVSSPSTGTVSLIP